MGVIHLWNISKWARWEPFPLMYILDNWYCLVYFQCWTGTTRYCRVYTYCRVYIYIYIYRYCLLNSLMYELKKYLILLFNYTFITINLLNYINFDFDVNTTLNSQFLYPSLKLLSLSISLNESRRHFFFFLYTQVVKLNYHFHL